MTNIYEKRFCPECHEKHEKSKVYNMGSTSTLIGGGGEYWDEEGEYHSHNPNTITTSYRCSKGHKWQIEKRRECPAGDY